MILALIGYTAFAYSDTAMKWIAPHYPAFQIMAIQTGIAATGLLFASRYLGGWRGAGDMRELRFHSARTIMNVLVSVLILYSFTIMSLASIYAMIFAKPFFAALLAIIFYKERVNVPRWVSIIVGFIGVLVILQPGPDTFKPELLIPLGAAALVAIMFISSRSLTEASPFVMSFYPLIGTCMVALPFAILGTPDFGALISEGRLDLIPSKPVAYQHIPFFIAAAALSATGILCVSLAFRHANAALVAPFLYTEMIWGLIFGYLLFSDAPDFWMLLGTAIIISSGLYLILVERWRRPMIATAPASAIPRPIRTQNPQPWNFFHPSSIKQTGKTLADKTTFKKARDIRRERRARQKQEI